MIVIVMIVGGSHHSPQYLSCFIIMRYLLYIKKKTENENYKVLKVF